MINKNENYLEWVLLCDELEEAREHLGELLGEMETDGFDESGYAVQIAHIFEHLNRAWNRRDTPHELSDEDWKRFSRFPADLDLQASVSGSSE